jgi:hypothetical protein
MLAKMLAELLIAESRDAINVLWIPDENSVQPDASTAQAAKLLSKSVSVLQLAKLELQRFAPARQSRISDSHALLVFLVAAFFCNPAAIASMPAARQDCSINLS